MSAKVFWSGVVVFSLIFSAWLMWHTFAFDATQRAMLISDKVWSDFGGHIPLIRSFSQGENWPPQNPLFPGEPIRYHFLFYAAAGLLERMGIRIDWAVNILSVSGFATTLVMVALLTKKLFASRLASVLAIIFFLFNGSLSFVVYFAKNGWNIDALKNIISNSQYPSFGPWDGGKIVAMWNLNVYTNQRHLGAGMALALVAIYLTVFRKTNFLIVALVLTLLLFVNQAVFMGATVILAWQFIQHSRLRKYLLMVGLSLIPGVLLSFALVHTASNIEFHPGFLLNDPINWATALNFWTQNLGLHLVLIPLGFILAPRQAKSFILGLITLFIIPNIFRLSPDMFNNHKLLNLFIIFGGMFSAYLVAQLLRRKVTFLLGLVLIFGLTFSGVIDFFALANDHRLTLQDSPQDRDILYIKTNTKPHDVVLNSRWFYHPASIAGRPIFNGYTYFTWSHGYDSYGREEVLKNIYQANSKRVACQLLLQNHIAVVELNDRPEDYLKPNFELWTGEFITDYYNPTSGVRFIFVEKNCNAI